MDVSSGKQPDPYEVIRWEGQDAMREFMSVRTAGHGTGFAGRSLHMQGNNLSVAVHGDTAVANGYSFILHQDGPQIKLVSASINEWLLRRVKGRWQIVEPSAAWWLTGHGAGAARDGGDGSGTVSEAAAKSSTTWPLACAT
jgi:hypothetical protein